VNTPANNNLKPKEQKANLEMVVIQISHHLPTKAYAAMKHWLETKG
jgi:hypothetical protein